MPYFILPESAWKRYNRGFVDCFKAYAVYLCEGIIYVPITGLLRLVGDSTPLRTVIFILGAVSYIVLFPFLVSFRENVDSSSPEETQKLREGLDLIGERLGIDWNEEPVGRVYRLLCDGKIDDARRLIKGESDRTWDEVDKMIEQWPQTVAERKIQTILDRLPPLRSSTPLDSNAAVQIIR